MADEPRHRILVVDDEECLRRLVSRQLDLDGYECTTAASGDEAWDLLQRAEYSLVVLDITMPGMSGLELLEKVRNARPDTAVIVVTGVDDRPTAIRALQLGAYGYIVKPFEANELVANVANALERRRLVMALRRHEQEFEQKVSERTAEVRATQEAIILRLLASAERRDEATGAGTRRIGLYAWQIAQQLGWEGRELEDIRLAAPMHDIGKIGVPDAILRKPGKLTAEEFEIMKRHTVIGAQMLSGEEAPLLRMARDIALWHHEKWDGNGYIHALAGDAIPLSARIVAVASVYDAMTHNRVYRPAIPETQTLEVMREGRGKHFAPAVFDAFMEGVSEFRKIREEISEP
ncbi:MAG: HD domain-containing phosphohydrolase [Candidatus Brocadiia bacterium]|jgi:putative two-component system response regulator